MSAQAHSRMRTRGFRSWRRGGAAALLALVAWPAYAQAPIFMTAPAPLSRVDGAAEALPPLPAPPLLPANAPPAQKAAPAPALAQAAPTRAIVLRHLPNNIQGYRLAGEIGSAEWPMFLTEAQARRKLQFQLGYLAAVSVMPEASSLTLTVNDQIVGETSIAAVQAVKTVVFNIPPGLMRAGFNSVRLSTEQRHRVDCSVEATQELWTQIDPTQTGLMLDEAGASIDQISDLGALPPDEQGALPIRLVTPPNAKTADIERLMRVAQLVSIVGRFEQPVVDAGPLAGGPYGVNLLAGTAQELAGVADELVGVVDRPRIFVAPATPARRTTIVVTGATLAQVDEAMKQFLVATKPKGAAAGLRAAAAFPGFRMAGGQRVKLSELGVRSEEFDGRLFRAAFNIIMPPDFYPADYGRATVRVAGGYAPGLTSNAQLLMYVNERSAVSLPLLKSTGEVFKDNPLPLPLGFLRPGLNRIEIEAHVPTDADKTCDTLAKNALNRFLFLNSTEIEIPPIARVGRMPDLAATATGGFPYAGARRPTLYLPRLDPKSTGAAATFAAHLAIAAGRPIDFEITQTVPTRRGPTLAVAPYDALDIDLLRKLNMPTNELSNVWRGKIGATAVTDDQGPLSKFELETQYRFALQNNFPMACRSGKSGTAAISPRRPADASPTNSVTPASESVIAAPAEDPGAGRDLFQEWDARVRNERRWNAIFSDAIVAAREWGKSKFTDAGEWIHHLERSQPKQEMAGTTLLAIGQNILGDSGEDVWTVVTAPNADTLASSVACFVDPRVSRQASGRLSLLDLAQAKIEATPVDSTRFVMTQPLSAGNVRLIAAGWLSLHALYYVGAAVIIALLLGVLTRIFVRNVGRKT